MKALLVSLSVVGAIAVSIPWLRNEHPSTSLQPTPPLTNEEGNKLLGRVPVAFVPNLGQWEHRASYVAKLGAMTVFLEERGWTFTLVDGGQKRQQSWMDGRAREPREPKPKPERGVAVRMSFVGASVPELIAADQLPGRHNYFLGNDPSKWRSDVPLYGSVSYRRLYAGIDVRVHEQGGHLEFDLLLEPKVQLEPVEVAVEGIERMRLDRGGALVMETQLGPVRMPSPLTWEEGPSGERSLVTCSYVLRGRDRFGFEVIGRRPGWALTVDPGLVYSTFLGGSGNDVARAVALDTQGATTVAGMSFSLDFPTTPGAFDTSHNGTALRADGFVTRFAPTGASLIYSTYLGGFDNDLALGIAIDAQGATTVAGETQAADFPTTPGAFDTSFNGGPDEGFVAQLSPTGSSLLYSTFLGGTGKDYAIAVALDAQGAATIAGYTYSTDFPTTPGAFDTSFNGGLPYGDAFVTRLASTGSSLVYSTFLGGVNADFAQAIALDAAGAATVAGQTTSANFPTTPGAFDISFNGGGADAFVTQLSPTGASLIYSTFIGGNAEDTALAIAVDAQGAATVAGSTRSMDFPTTAGAYNTTFNGGTWDVFVTRILPMGSSLAYSTFLGGNSRDELTAFGLDAQGAATVAGLTESTNFPTTPGAFDTSFNRVLELFVSRLSPTGAGLVYSTFFGGTRNDEAEALIIDVQGAATLTGWTSSPDFPTTPGAFDRSYHGTFVSRLDMLPTGVSAFGRSSPGCNGPLAMSVTSMPRVGNAGFALTCGNARAFTMGMCAVTANRFVTPTLVLGNVEAWVDPALLFVPLMSFSNALGASEVALAVPNNPALAGARFFTQFFWVGSTAPPPCPPLGWSASHALDITIQP